MKMEILLSKDEFQKVVSESIVDSDSTEAQGEVQSDGAIAIELGSIITTKEEFVNNILNWLEIPAPDNMKAERVDFLPDGKVGVVITSER